MAGLNAVDFLLEQMPAGLRAVYADMLEPRGDVAGHDFHGNQYVAGEGVSHDDHPKKWSKDIAAQLNAGGRPSIKASQLDTLLTKAAKSGNSAYVTADITNLKIDGTNLMGVNGLGYPRSEMPQVPKEARDQYFKDMATQGFASTTEMVDPTTLQPSQSEIGVARVAEIYAKADGQIDVNKQIVISQDNYIVDGHHHWAADVAIALVDPSQKMSVVRLAGNARDVIAASQAWSTAHGGVTKAIGERWSDILEPRGDVAGHDFHGNQHTGGIGGGGKDYSLTTAKASGLSNIQSSAKTEAAIQKVAYANESKAAATEDDPEPYLDNPKFANKEVFLGMAGETKAAVGAAIEARMGSQWTPQLAGMSTSNYGDGFNHDDVYARYPDSERWGYIGNPVTGVDASPGTKWGDPYSASGSFLKDPSSYETTQGDNPEIITQARQDGVDYLIQQWAQTSNDSDPMSLGMQQAAREEFGLTGTRVWDTSAGLAPQVQQDLVQNGRLYQAFLRAQYDNTQQFFKDNGITEVPLFRGFNFNRSIAAGQPLPDWVQKGTDQSISLRPLSSFSYDVPTAVKFATADYWSTRNAVIAGVVPASQILSTAVTGNGCLGEFEMLVLGGTHKWTVTTQ